MGRSVRRPGGAWVGLAVLLGLSMLLGSLGGSPNVPSAPADRGVPRSGSLPHGPEAVRDGAASIQRLGPASIPFASWSTNATGNLSSGEIAVDAGNGTLYSANTLAGTVTELNVSSGALIASRAVVPYDPGRRPISLFFDGVEGILIVGMGSLPPAPPVQGQLLALNPQSLAIVELMNDSQIPGFTPHAFAYDPPTHRFFVANATDGYVGIFNATTLYEVTTLHAPCPTTCPDGEVADTLNGQVWQTDGSPSIYRIWARNTTYLPKTLQDPHGGFDPGAMVAVPLGTPSAPNRSIVWIATYQGPYFEGFNSTNGAWWANTSASGGVTALAYVPAPGAFLAGESIGNPGNLEVQSFLAASGVPLHDYNFSIPSPSSGIARITGIQPAATGTGLVAVGGYGPGVDRELNVSNRSGGAEDTLASVRSYRVAPSVQEASLWDPANGSFLVADEDPNQLCSYNATTGALLWNVTLGSAPITDLALDPAKGWVFLGLPGNIVATFDASNGSSVGAIHVNSTAPMGVAFDPTVGRLFLLNGSGNGTVTEWNDSTWPPRLVGPFAPRRSSTAENTTAIFCDPSWNGIWYVGNAGPGTTVARAFNFSSMKSGAGGILPFSDPLDAGTVNATGWLFLPDPLEAAVQAFSPSGSSSLRLATNGFGVTSVAVDTAERVAYLGSNVSAEVGVLDLATGQILGSLNAGGSVTAAGLALGSGPGILLDPPASTGDQVYFAELAAPSPPSNVTVVSSNASLLVRWSPPSQPLPVPLLGFTVEAQAGLGEPGQDSGNSTNMTLDAATVTGLSDGTNYTVWVASINAAGTGSESPGVVGIPLGVPYPPSAPVETRSSTATISLSWSPPKLTGGASVTGYFVRWAKAPGAPWEVADSGTPNWTLTGLSPGTSYEVEVVALNALGSGHPSAASLVSTAPSTGGTVLGLPFDTAAVLVVAAAVLASVAGYGVLRRSRRRRRGREEPPPRISGPDLARTDPEGPA